MSTPNEPTPSTSRDFLEPNRLLVNPPAAEDSANNDEATDKDKEAKNEADEENLLNKTLSMEEFLIKSKTYMLDYEKTMFLDAIDSDCLIVCAK